MEINKTNAIKLWEERFGKNVKFTTDFHGKLIHKDGYGNPSFGKWVDGKYVRCGWNIHHILPIAKGGTNEKSNLLFTHITTNEIAGDKTTFWIDDSLYQVQRIFGTSDHEIVCLTDFT